MRYTRHELKQDKFAESAAEAVHWTVEHRQKLINVAIACATLLVFVIGGWWIYNYRSNQASEQLGAALAIYGAPVRPAGMPADPNYQSYASVQERATAAKAEFAKIADKYGSTHSGQLARYFVAICEQDLGNNAGAEQQLKDVSGVRDADVASLAKFALASLYRSTNRDADAVHNLKELSDHPTRTVPRTTALMELADLYAVKQPAEARKVYEQISKEDPKGAAAEIAQQKQAALK